MWCWGASVGLLAIGFMAGSFYQDAKVGYHFKVIAEKEYPSAIGIVRWIHASESVGADVLAPDTTMIVCGDRTIYKAKREFQESSPFAADLKVSGNVIEWDDGISKFELTVSDKKSNAR